MNGKTVQLDKFFSKILVVDNHELVLQGICQLLEQNFPNAIIFTATSGKDAIKLVSQNNINLVSLDLELQDMTGFNLIDHIQAMTKQSKILVNTTHDEIWTVERLAKRHVEGIIFKSAKASDYISAVYKILKGESYYDHIALSLIKAMSSQKANEAGLTSREMDVLRLIANGYNTEEIATRICLSPNTIETHRRHLLEKLSVRNAPELIRRAISSGILSPIDEII